VLKSIFRKTHNYTACYKPADYLAKVLADPMYDEHLIDVDLGKGSVLGDEVAIQARRLGRRVNAVLMSAFGDKLDKLKIDYGPLFSGYVYRGNSTTFKKEIMHAVECAIRTGDIVDDTTAMVETLWHWADELGILDDVVPHSYLEELLSADMVGANEQGLAQKETIRSLLQSCRVNPDDLEHVRCIIGIVQKLIHDKDMS
jgi:hypothetical protein